MPCVSALQAELKLLNIDNVGLHNLSPGMVTTDLLMSGRPSHLTSSDFSSAGTYTSPCDVKGVRVFSKVVLGTGADTKVSKFFINCLAEEPDEVVKFLVPRIRKVHRVDATTCVKQFMNSLKVHNV